MSLLTDLLKSVPAKYRRVMLWVYALVVAVSGVLTLANVEIPVDNWQEILLLVGGYLGVQSAVNVNVKPADAVKEFYELSDDSGEHKA